MNETTDKLLRDFAEKLGTTVEHLWQVLIRQAYIEAVSDLLIAAGSLFILHLFAKWVKSRSGKGGIDFDGNPFPYALLAVSIIVASVFVCIALCNVPTALFNPEFWAYKQLPIPTK